MLGGEGLKINLLQPPAHRGCSWPASRAPARPRPPASSPAASRAQGRQPLLVGRRTCSARAPSTHSSCAPLGRQVDVPVSLRGDGHRALRQGRSRCALAERAVQEARRLGKDVLIIDTRRPPGDRRGAEWTRCGASRERTDAALHLPRLRRHDRSGRRRHTAQRFTRRSPSTGSSCPSSTRRPIGVRALVKEVIGRLRSPAPRPVRSSTPSSSSTPTAWPDASSAWATCSASSRRPSRPSTRSRPSRRQPS